MFGERSGDGGGTPGAKAAMRNLQKNQTHHLEEVPTERKSLGTASMQYGTDEVSVTPQALDAMMRSAMTKRAQYLQARGVAWRRHGGTAVWLPVGTKLKRKRQHASERWPRTEIILR